jgi:cell wall-associated NlpC family hydrolase
MSKIINFARLQVGKPYVFGTSGPDSFDCSALPNVR